MHKLERAEVATPECLVDPPPERRYNTLSGLQKGSIRDRLLEMQRDRCAYCERRTGREPDDGHIEHFRNQAGHDDLGMAWTNMYWSCNDEKSCGKHKDKCDRPAGTGPVAVFDPAHLIDPAVDDPDQFLQFRSDGNVGCRAGLDVVATRRATETLRVFRLEASPFLKKSREDAVKPYLSAIDSLLPHGLETVHRYLERELPNIDSAPFSTTIRHYLRGVL